MGIIKSIQKMFSKNIDCGDILDNTPFHFYSQKNRVVYIGSNIVVRDGFEAVFVCRDKVTEILQAGKHAIISSNLPKTFKRMHLLTAKNGSFATKFKADIYFVSKNQVRDLKFCGNLPYKTKSKRFGRVKGYPEGYFDLLILDSQKLLKCLLKERAYVTDEDFLSMMSREVGTVINEKLMTCGKGFVDIVSESEIISQMFNSEPLSLDYLGCVISNIRLVSMKIPEQLEAKVSSEIENRREVNSEINGIYGTDLNEIFGNISNVEVEDNHFMEQSERTEESGFKNCLSCGKSIEKNAKFCPNCGAKQNLF